MSTPVANFTANARVVDLLGRQQIADAPTAVSEVLKNALDAGASSADVKYSTAAESLQINDDGIGMRTTDLVEKWLTLATSSKLGEPDEAWLEGATAQQRTSILAHAPLGEKGIGRLAIAYLGRAVLIWTRWQSDQDKQYTLAFVHWTLFEHPRLSLNDIIIPYLTFSHQEVTSRDALQLLDELRQWVHSHPQLWLSDAEKSIRHRILSDLDQQFQDSLKNFDDYRVTPGTLFLLLGTTPEVAELFRREAEEEYPVEGIKLVLGFSDPFTQGASRLVIDIEVDGKNIRQRGVTPEERNFWKPDDFRLADHEINVCMDGNGHITGSIRRFEETIPYTLVVTDLPARSYLPGPLRIHIGYVEGELQFSHLPEAEFNSMTRRLRAYGALYVYRDSIRILPYGRDDIDFLRFEVRRTLNAGRYFFSHRRMFGALYLTKEDNPYLVDKAGREGFVMNGAYRGLVYCLTTLFVDLADRYYGRKAERLDKAENKKSKAALAVKERTKRDYEQFLLSLKMWDEELSIKKEEVEHQAHELYTKLSGATNVQHGKSIILRECSSQLAGLRDQWIGTLDHLGTRAPASVTLPNNVLERFDEYLTRRQGFEESGLRRLNGLQAQLWALESTVAEERHRVAEVQHRIDVVRRAYEERLSASLASFRVMLHEIERSAVIWHQEQNDVLRKLIIIEFGEDALEQVADDHTGTQIAMLETVLAKQQRQLREDFLPFWSMAEEQLRHLHSAEGGEFALNALHREVEALAERDRMLTELAQSGLVVEALNHEYNIGFQNVDEEINRLLNIPDVPAEILTVVNDLHTKIVAMKQRLEFLSPLYRQKGDQRTDITGEDIRGFIERLYPQDKRETMNITYTSTFVKQGLTNVNRAAVLAAAANLVSNSLYWTARGTRQREVRFSSFAQGFVVSDTGPGIATRDRERVFEPFFSRRPFGRGLGLYITRSNLRDGGLEIRLAEQPQKNALPGANFIICKREEEQSAS